MPTVSAKSAQLHYSTRGRGPTCLVLSAIGAAPYERQLLPPLPDHLRLAHVDLRGTGRSTGQPSELTFDVLAEDLEAVRRDLGVERVAVLGHSVLGVLAIEYARRCPDRVSHVITAGTPPSGDMARLTEQAMAFFQEDASEERKRIQMENLGRLGPTSSMGDVLMAQTPSRFFDPRFNAAPFFEGAEARPEVLQHLMGALVAGWDVVAAAGSLRAPLLIAQGRYDYTVPHTVWRGVVERLPGATFQLFERSGHQPFLEEPERFSEVVTKWMGRAS